MLTTSLNIIQRMSLPRLRIAPMLLTLFGRAPVARAGDTYGDGTMVQSTPEGTLTPLAALPGVNITVAGGVETLATSPDVSIYAPDGSGTLSVSPGGFAPRQTGAGLTFTYTVPAGGLWLGELTVTVPAGWTPPTVTESSILCCPTLPISDPGSVTTSSGTVSVSGQTITVAGITLDPGRTVTITYSNVTVGRTRGSFRFAAQQRSTQFGTLKPLPASPSVTVGSAIAPGAGFRT